MSDDIKMDHQHTNIREAFCCPHCVKDNDIDDWHRSEENEADVHTCSECGQDFAYAWRTTVEYISGFIVKPDQEEEA